MISNFNKFYKLYVPESIDHAILVIETITFANQQEAVSFRVRADGLPTIDKNLNNFYLNSGNATEPYYAKVWTKEDTWHYVEFAFENRTNSSLVFKVKFFSSSITSPPLTSFNTSGNKTNQTNYYNDGLDRVYQIGRLSDVVPYKQYNLFKDVNTESFLFSYDLEMALEQLIAVPINVTTDSLSVLRFSLQEGSDIGGTLQVILAFKPRTKQTSAGRVFDDEPENNVIVACMRRNAREIPKWPNKCVFNEQERVAPLILNKTVDNATVYIPYPEPGVWFVTFRWVKININFA